MTPARPHPCDLEPSIVDHRTYTTRRRRHLLDSGSLLALTLTLAILVPANLVVPQMSGVGRPTLMVGLVLATAWFVCRLHPRLAAPGPQPLRWAAAAYLAAMLLAYAAGHLRGLPELEANGADRSMISTIVFLGVALVCADGLRDRARLDDVLRVLVWLATVMALIGHIQFAFDFDVVRLIQVPGLVDPSGPVGFRARGDGFFQVASTASHYIEFSTVMALALPLAIHLARFDGTPLARQCATACAVVIGTAIPITLSRTGFVGLSAGMLVMALYWGWRMRFTMAVAALAVTSAMMVIRPGLVGTIRSLFVHAAEDPSVQGRTADYAATAEYIKDRPWLGRGPGTFIPDLYRFVDNDWLVHLITTGIVGAAAYAAWHLTALSLAAIAYRRAIREEDRHLCACLVAVQVVAALVAFLFDAQAFSTHTTVLAVLSGAAGVMWRLTHPCRQVRSATARVGATAVLRRPAAQATSSSAVTPSSARALPTSSR